MPTRPQAAQATQPTIHHPRPAIVSTDARYATQRRFGTTPTMQTNCGAEVQVLRHADDDMANVRFEKDVYWSSKVSATPAELRELAARLIDAAHDIETFPAAALAGGAP